ncbi:MAG: site-specific integrase, partial [Desulfobacteraceae bacterium]|nr:site-specific integrase [Desulfobacteraceae bacterium]
MGIDILDRFVDILVAEKGYSPHTCRAYRSDIMDFLHFFTDIPGHPPGPGMEEAVSKTFMARVAEVDKDVVKRYLALQVKAKKKKKTLSRRLSALKAFFAFLVRDKHLAANPADGIPFPKLGRSIPRVLTVDDVYQLLDSIKTDTWLEKRNCAMFETFYSTGMRISEIHGMNMD